MPGEAPVDLDLEPAEVRMLICNRSAQIANTIMQGAPKDKVIALATRIIELAQALPTTPEEKPR